VRIDFKFLIKYVWVKDIKKKQNTAKTANEMKRTGNIQNKTLRLRSMFDDGVGSGYKKWRVRVTVSP
jgi:hypothetical protein